MMKEHCDNCDAVIADAQIARYLTVQPLGFQCTVEVRIAKNGESKALCAECLTSAALAFVDATKPRPRAEEASPHD